MNIPDEDPQTFKNFTLRSKGFSILGYHLEEADTEEHVAAWIRYLPLQTVARILHVTGLAGPGWTFSSVNGDGTQKRKSDMVWRYRTQEGLIKYYLTLEVKSPCEYLPYRFVSRVTDLSSLLGCLGPGDCQLFINLQKVRHFSNLFVVADH